MKKFLVIFYLCLAAITVVLYFTNNTASNDLVGIIFLVTTIPAIFTVSALIVNLYRLISFSQNSFLDLSAEMQQTEAYPGMPLGISRDADDAEEARRITRRRLFMYFIIVSLQLITLCLLFTRY